MSMMSSVGPSIADDQVGGLEPLDAPFAFTGALHEVVIQLLSRADVAAREAEAAAEMSRQ